MLPISLAFVDINCVPTQLVHNTITIMLSKHQYVQSSCLQLAINSKALRIQISSAGVNYSVTIVQ